MARLRVFVCLTFLFILCVSEWSGRRHGAERSHVLYGHLHETGSCRGREDSGRRQLIDEVRTSHLRAAC
jgi:hypothetical protein